TTALYTLSHTTLFRSTSTYDGLSIAWSVCEYLHNTQGQTPKTLFATHYHELTGLEGALPRLRNFHVAVLEEKDRIVFLFKVIPRSEEQRLNSSHVKIS